MMCVVRRATFFICIVGALGGVPSSSARAERSVVVGTTGVDDDHTTLWRVPVDTASSPPTTLGAITHRAGYAPVGVVMNDDLVALVVETGSTRDASLVLYELASQQQRLIVDEVVPRQPPVRAGQTVQLTRHYPQGSEHPAKGTDGEVFEIVDVDVLTGQLQVHSTMPAGWLTPVRAADGPSGRALRLIGDAFDVVDVDHPTVAIAHLGAGVFRQPVMVGAHLVVERGDPKAPHRASLVRWRDNTTLLTGLAGFHALPLTDTALLAGNGRKDGGLVRVDVDTGKQQPIAGARAGVAAPLLVHDDVAVVWIDRGQALPGELWSMPLTTDAPRARRLLPATPRTAVTVYGVIDAGHHTPTTGGAP